VTSSFTTVAKEHITINMSIKQSIYGNKVHKPCSKPRYHGKIYYLYELIQVISFIKIMIKKRAYSRIKLNTLFFTPHVRGNVLAGRPCADVGILTRTWTPRVGPTAVCVCVCARVRACVRACDVCDVCIGPQMKVTDRQTDRQTDGLWCHLRDFVTYETGDPPHGTAEPLVWWVRR